MEEIRNYTVDEVMELYNTRIIPTYANTKEGQAHLNRIAKAITNESIEKRKVSSRQTHAEVAFNKKLGNVAAKTPEKVTEFMANKDTWISNYISVKYANEDE